MRARSNLLAVVGDDLLAVAQHGDAVGQDQRLFQRVADEDDGNAALLEVAHEIEEVFPFFRRQGRGRLVEDDHLRIVQHRARDLDHLLLGRAQRADRRGGRNVEVERLQELLRRDIDAAQAVVEAFLTEEQVLRHRHASAPGCSPGTPWRRRDGALPAACSARPRAVDLHRARGQGHDARHHLRQGRLAGAVLADERMDLAARELEVDVLDRRHARVELRRLFEGKNDVAHATNSSASPSVGRRSTRRGPLAIM